jgi:poly(A) polymerase|tara:strand:+ start:791 stop:1990 length:1200 start_codon:yes stop_codon:yes gene_type:complete
MIAPETRAVIDALSAKGTVVRFVGGCVRNTLLARPVADIDLATPDTPEMVTALLEEAGLRAIPTGIKHGTITAVVESRPFEVTTLRRDVETYGRHAKIAFTDDWEADSMRRDFTINAIYCDPDGTLYDPHGGKVDLCAGRVRFVGNARERIAEDVLRLLRFFRFHAWFGSGGADEEALAACREAAPELERLSVERVWCELKKLLAAPDPASDIQLMKENGILKHVLPEIKTVTGQKSPLAALTAIEDELGEPDPLRRLAVLLSDKRAVGVAKTMAARLKLSNTECDRMIALTGDGYDLGGNFVRWRRALYTSGPELFHDRVLLAWATDPQGKETYKKMLAEADGWTPPSLPITGTDVIAMGMEPGEAVGKLLSQLEDWWIAEDFQPTRKDCLAKLRALK